ncbi:MAG: hypothetical protein IPP74_15865 [Alphaproteobacteria bacterium]|nr:hypothetical protein [Alphaproteobacteria bacterium]
MIAAGKELRPLVEDAERQAAAENVNQDSEIKGRARSDRNERPKILDIRAAGRTAH